MSSDEEILNLQEIKENKKKKLSEKWKEAKLKNIHKALDAKKKKFEERQKLWKIQWNIKNIINNSWWDEESEWVESKKSDKKIKKKNNFQNETKNNEFNNDLKWILEKINYIDKKVEKLYIMKKNKKNNKPIIIENKNNKDDILTALRNKMLNN